MNTKTVRKIESDLRVAAACLDTVANSLYFAEERKDHDITKAASVCVELVKGMIEKSIESLESVTWENDIKEIREA